MRKLAVRMDRPPKRIGESAIRALRAYGWPGNVRELEHAIEHAFVLSQGDVIGASDLPIQTSEDDTFGAVEPPTAILSEAPASRETYALPYAEAKKRILADFDLAYVREQLRRTGGNVSDAARRSGLDRSNFRRVMRRLRGEE